MGKKMLVAYFSASGVTAKAAGKLAEAAGVWECGADGGMDPAGLDVGLINKYYDLARSGDELARNHYENLAVKADACIRCGHCNSRCPFHVDQVARMQEISDYFKR